MTAAELAERVGAKHIGKEFLATCPAHPDQHPSLNFTDGDKGVVLTCRSRGCRREDIVAAWGLTFADLANDTNVKAKVTAASKIEATYEYENEQNEVLYEGVRYEPKGFKQRRPNGKGGWIWNMRGVRRVVYHLPDIRFQLQDPDCQEQRRQQGLPDDVFACEGERDADRLWRQGLIATTNVGGAGKWRADYSQQLVDAGAKSIIVLADNDDAGRAHAEDVARSCHAADLTVKVLMLPNLPAKGDVSDWLRLEAAGQTVEKLVALASATPVYPTTTIAPPAVGTEPIDLAGTLLNVEVFIRNYVVLTDQQATALTLWTAHTHVIGAADTTPYLHISSATKRAGKTRLLEVLEPLVARPWLTGRTSPAALVRKVDSAQPTLLLDESDAAFGGEKEYAEALRGILNTGYKRNGKATLCVGKGADITVRDFSTFCPKAIAGIGKLPDTVADRAIPIVLRRRIASEAVQRWRDRDGRAEAAPLYQALTAWSGPALDHLRAARPALPSQLSDRAADVWEPLLAIADLAGGAWPARGRRAAVALVGTVEDTDPTTELLTDIKDIIATAEAIIPTKDLIEQLTAQEDRPWATWRRNDKPITARGLAGLLGPLGIHPDRHLRTARGYRVAAFADAILRYLPSQVSTCHNPNEYGPELRDGNDLDVDAQNASVTRFTPDSIGAVTHGHIDTGDDEDASYYGA